MLPSTKWKVWSRFLPRSTMMEWTSLLKWLSRIKAPEWPCSNWRMYSNLFKVTKEILRNILVMELAYRFVRIFANNSVVRSVWVQHWIRAQNLDSQWLYQSKMKKKNWLSKAKPWSESIKCQQSSRWLTSKILIVSTKILNLLVIIIEMNQ